MPISLGDLARSGLMACPALGGPCYGTCEGCPAVSGLGAAPSPVPAKKRRSRRGGFVERAARSFRKVTGAVDEARAAAENANAPPEDREPRARGGFPWGKLLLGLLGVGAGVAVYSRASRKSRAG